MPDIFFKRIWNIFWTLQKEKAVSYTRNEYYELEHFFITIVLMQFFGYPIPFSMVSFDLLPSVLEEIKDIPLLEIYSDDIFVRLASNVEGL